jgi:predicted ATPase
LVLAHFFKQGRWGLLVQTGPEGESLAAEDQLFILMQAGLYLTATRGYGAREAQTCYERVESLCNSHRLVIPHSVLISQWRYSLVTDKLSATMRIAKRIFSLAQERNDTALMMGAYRALGTTAYFLGDFELAREYLTRGLQIWRSGDVQCQVEEVTAHPVACLYYSALVEWNFGEFASCQAAIAEAIVLAKDLNDIHGLAVSLYFAGVLAQLERNPVEVERVASNMIKLSTRQNFALWLACGTLLRGWARSVFGDIVEGISLIQEGIAGVHATGTMVFTPFWLALKAEALYLAGRTPEALETIREAEAHAERFQERWWCAELHRLRGVFLTAIGAEETQIEASFQEAIRTAKQQKSVSLEKRAEATYAEYRRQKASGSGREFRLPL